MSRTVAVVAHTHWDREWYAPFERFRSRLVGVVDALLKHLEDDPSVPYFMLDGQVALIDDYLAVRPAAEDSIRGLVEAGRLAMGPWYILMDEFCVSGETIVRNLQLGLRRAAEFGGAMPVGYLPDMFGHIAQMPQLLRLAGLEHAVVWRGVPAVVNRTAFWWRAPDGSTVRAEYLPVGYANGAFLPDGADALVRRLEAHQSEVAALLGQPATSILLMNGTDHHGLQTNVPALLSEANQTQNHFDFHQMTLTDYLAGAPIDGLPEWSGELRSGYRAPILMGVLSNRVDLKAAAAVVEREVERVAEPLAVLWLPPEEWPGPLLDEAWLAMIRNSAHDSICACSADQVGRAVIHRYDTAAALADEVTQRALALAGVATESAGWVVVNPGSVEASGVVEAVLPGTKPVPGTQILTRTAAGSEQRTGVGADLGRLLGELAADGWLPDGRGVDAEVTTGADGIQLVIEVDATRRRSLQLPAVMAEAWAQAGAHGSERLEVRVERRPSQRVAARVCGIPGFGWAAFSPQPSGAQDVKAGPLWLDNSVVRLEVDATQGTFSLNGLTGFDRLTDEGDEGDTYNYAALRFDECVDQPGSVDVELIEAGPVRGRLRIRRRYMWPAAVRDGRRAGEKLVEIVSDLELRAGEQLIRVTTSFDNPSRDHRLRAWFPLPHPADQTVAECAFATVTRGAAEGGRREPPMGTFPARRFVSAGGLTVVHEGLLEYELTGGGTALALTLLRSTGVLSRPVLDTRPMAAGPADPLQAPQLIGAHRVRYALAVAAPDPWRLADLAWVPLHLVASTGTGRLGRRGSRLQVRGAEVSALHRVEGAIELRVFNPSEAVTTVEVPGHAGWLVDLRGQPVERFAGEFMLRPWGIATARLDAVSLDP